MSDLAFRIVESKKAGAPTATFRRFDGRECYLHSRYDPIEEGQFLAAGVPPEPRTLYVALGFGLGYHVHALLRHVPPGSHVAVIEPAAAPLSTMWRASAPPGATGWTADPRLHVAALHAPEAASLHLAYLMTRLHLTGLRIVPHVPSMQTAPDDYRALADGIPQLLPKTIQGRLDAIGHSLDHHLKNFWANLRHSWSAVPAERLEGQWTGRPAVVVSAGPSLRDALPALTRVRERALVIAVGTAARVLAAHGIRPDLLVSIDPYDENRAHFEGWDATGVPLVYHHMVNRQVLATYPGPRFFFVTRDDPPVPLRPSKEASAFVGGGTVSFSALQVAHVLGANPVILLGQDFAFASGHTHAEGSASDVAFDPDVPSGERFLVPGTSGAPVLTNRVYRDYLLYMQEYLRHCASRRPGIVHINASKTGALIQGTEYKPLEEAIASAAPCDARAWADVTRSLLRQHEGVSEAARSAAVRQWHGEVRQIVDDSRVLTDCGGLLTAFAETSAGRQAGRMYADVAYLFEARYSQAPPDAREQFRARIEAHLLWLLDELGRLHPDPAS